MQSENDDQWLNEIQCLEEISSQPDYEREFITQRETSIRNVWSAFQDSATAIAQLYREKSGNNSTGSFWIPFQAAAASVTTLCKESCEGVKRTGEVAVQCGYQRRNRELFDWARSKRKRYIRREDLLAYLAGRSTSSFHHRVSQLRLSPKPENQHNSNSQFLVGSNQMSGDSSDLHTFKEALARKQRTHELYTFVNSEVALHCKRPASPIDVNMDVQISCNKKQRFS